MEISNFTNNDRQTTNEGLEKSILYPHHGWECITWETIQFEDSTFLLKTFIRKKHSSCVFAKTRRFLWLKPLRGSKNQYWEFFKQADDTYLIRLKGTELYITISAEDDNFEIILMPKDDSDKQKWKLIRQPPWN